MSKREKALLMPKLQFPEFRNTKWVVKLLGEIAPLQRGFDLPSDLIRSGKIPVVYSNGIQRCHDIGMASAPGLMTGRSGTIGKLHFIEEGEYWPHNTSLWVTDFKGNVPRFVYYLYESIGMSQFSSGSGVPTLNRNDVHAFNSSISISAFEQQKIADCLSSLDELIAAQARKVDALTTHKKGLMQQLFPQEGEAQPRLRFPEFQNSSEWTLDALENLCSAKISYGIVQAGPHVPGGMPYIKSSDLNSEICLETLSCTSKLIAEKYRRSEVLPGDLVFSLRGNIGMCRIVPDEISCANLTQGTARLRAKGSAEFLLQLIQSQRISDRILAASKGSTFQEISLGVLRAIPVVFPELDEQTRIADCLNGFDHFINVQTQELETLKTHKKGLMQQLFPSAEAVEA